MSRARARARMPGRTAAIGTMPASLATQMEFVTHGPGGCVRREDRAHRRASWAARRTPAKVLALHLGVSESRARHQRTDDQGGPLTVFCSLIADPNVDGAALMVAVMAAFEERFVFAPTADLRARLKYLREVAEHVAEAEQNRAVMVRDASRAEACLNHAAVLVEMSVLEELLGIEEVH